MIGMLEAPIQKLSSIAPIGRDRIVQLASAIRDRYDPRKIDAAAQENDIVLVRSAGANGRDAWICVHQSKFGVRN